MLDTLLNAAGLIVNLGLLVMVLIVMAACIRRGDDD